MRILQVIGAVDNPSAGPTYSVARLADELAGRGDDVSVVALGDEPLLWPHAAPLRVYPSGMHTLGGVSLPLVADLREAARAPVILHGHGVWRFANLFPLMMPARTPARLVCSPRGMLSWWSMNHKGRIKRPFWRGLQRPALARCHCLHATADIEYEDIRRMGLKVPVAVIPNGIDVPPEFPIANREKKVIFLSRIDPKKGLDILMRAWSSVAPRHPDWELLIAGPMEGTYAREIRALAARLSLPRTRFLGQVLGDEKRAVLADSSLFVLPSHSENFGIAVAEALAHGLPVITTRGTPWSKVVEHGCGWYVRAEEGDVRDALDAALRQPLAALGAMGRKGREWMLRDFSWSGVAKRMHGTYEWLLHRSRPPDWVALD